MIMPGFAVMDPQDAMGKLNAAWHQRHPIPKKATLDQRVRWHLAHAASCACRAIPETVLQKLRRRKKTAL
jgi:hypothetical protein